MIRKAVSLPRRFLKLTTEATENKATQGNLTKDAFDAVSQEWQAAIVGNTYDTQAMAHFDATVQQNFGTVNNPHVIYTADTPFRYVGCTGQPNEDDYEGHEFLIMMLREGPLQRCPQCGQVYKLVRIRNEFSAEMDYYRSGQLPLDMLNMGDADHWSQNSVMRLMPHSWDHTQFENETSNVYSLVNPDEHDRILTDPAYRLEKLRKAQTTSAAYFSAMRLVEQEYRASHKVNYVIPMNKVDFQTLLTAEAAIRKTDRMYTNLRRFHARQFLDPLNHERREARMLKRAKRRQVDSYTVFFGGLSEQEQNIRDYFETDLKDQPHDEAALEAVDEEVVRALKDYKVGNYDFQEMYTKRPTQDATSIEEKLVFRFVNRRCFDTVTDYERRQTRLVERSLERSRANQAFGTQATQASLSGDQSQLRQVESQYLDSVVEEAIQQYADYFESEGEEAVETLRRGSIQTRVNLLEGYRDHSKNPRNSRGFYSIPKRKRDLNTGIVADTLSELADYSTFVLPKSQELADNVQMNIFAGSAAHYSANQTRLIAEQVKGTTELPEHQDPKIN